MTDSIVERVLRLRKDTLEIANDSLDHDLRAYRVLSDVAIRLTDIIQKNGTSESPITVNQSSPIAPTSLMPTVTDRGFSRTIPIYARYNGSIYEAQLDPSRISTGKRDYCIYFEGQWMTASGSAMRFTTSNVDGWEFWRYKRDDDSEGRIDEIRKR